jgi:DNA-binding response OmpR family regulator
MRTILVIDDSPAVRSTMARILESAGYKVVLANDGLQGIAAFRKEPPDLVITDIVMPEEEGIATIRRMLSERPSTKIIAISGGGRVGNIDFLKLARKMGASEALPKPFDPESLLAIVSAHLKSG